jgi:hypothetical protein
LGVDIITWAPAISVIGPGRVVRVDRDEERLGHRRDLLQLADPAGADHVGHQGVGQLALEHRPELPAGVEPLADADRHAAAVAELAYRVGVLGRCGGASG